MEITIKINTDNAAFQDEDRHGGISRETARILHKLADQFERDGIGMVSPEGVYDINGNRVGEVTVT